MSPPAAPAPSRRTRPVSVTIVAFCYLAVGAIGLAYHLTEFNAGTRLDYGWLVVEIIRVVAIVSGIYILSGRNWARWVAVAWIALHVVVSAFHTTPELLMHALLSAVIAWLLFRPVAAGYFQPSKGVLY